jgi:4-amino-4-deoxy-L-arabinose transferase-like glycosyltransferase
MNIRAHLTTVLAIQLTPSRVMALVLICFTLLSAAVLSLTPPWEANDEPDHIRNVEVLASGHWYRITSDSGFESHQAPLYYLLLAAYQKLARFPVEMPDGQLGPIADNQLHGNYLHNTPQDGKDQRWVDLLRLPSIVFGLLAICLTYVAAGRVSRDPWTPVVSAALIASVPRFVFLSGVVNNDNLSNVLGAAGLAVALGLLMSPPSTQRGRLLGAAAVGLVVGMLVLTKVTNILVGPGLLMAVMLIARNRRERLQLATVLLAAALAVCGWWFVQNQVRYGDPLAAKAARTHLKALFPPLFEIAGPIERIFVQIPQGIYKSFWYQSGYNQFSWRWFWYIPFWIGALVGIGGLLWWRRRLPIQREVLWVLSTVAVGALAIVWVLGLETSTEEARVAFVGLPSIAVLIALGYERLDLAPALRFMLPVIGLIGTIAAIRYNVVIPYS